MTAKKIIWCISKYASTPKYGIGARIFYVAREFSRMGHEVLLVASDSNHMAHYPESDSIYNFDTYENLEYMWIKTMKYKKSASLKRFISWVDFDIKLFKSKRLSRNKPDVVIISSLALSSILFGIYLKRKYNCKLVFEIRDIHPLNLTEEFGVSKWNPAIFCLGFLEKIGYKKADLIVGTMPNLSQHVKEIIGVDKNVFHSPIGIPEIWHENILNNKEIDDLFPKGKKFVIGYAGSMGVSNALEPFTSVIKKIEYDDEFYFVMVGDGDLKERYKKNLSDNKNVKIGPKIAQKDIPYFLSKCDLLYISTLNSKMWKYGQSLNKLIDYMMSAKPVVMSYSGFPSMLNEANSGLFVPVNDEESIVNALVFFKNMSLKERIEYGKRGRKWILANQTYEIIAKKYSERIIELFNE